MQTYRVALGDRSYPIHIGAGLLGRVDLITPHLRSKRVAIITNEVVAPLYLDSFRRYLDGAGIRSDTIVLPDRKSTRLNSSHVSESRMPSSA